MVKYEVISLCAELTGEEHVDASGVLVYRRCPGVHRLQEDKQTFNTNRSRMKEHLHIQSYNAQ